MLELIRATGDKDKPEATLRSFVNQDYESVHRHAKINWALRHGQYVFSNQHDGLGIGLDSGYDANSVAAALTQEVSASCGYPLRVEVKQMAHRRPQTKDFAWPKMRTTAFEGDAHVPITPTGIEVRLKDALIAVMRGDASNIVIEQDTTILSTHDTTNEDFCQRAARACTFEVKIDDDAQGDPAAMLGNNLVRTALRSLSPTDSMYSATEGSSAIPRSPSQPSNTNSTESSTPTSILTTLDVLLRSATMPGPSARVSSLTTARVSSLMVRRDCACAMPDCNA
mmetsp:Transcript_44361/g.100199  ORF Transcript_44361/g.100199 Transcript_44361/m.100199 type:complete len:282 (-) Transcript_44361:461-1306(-)